MRLNKNYILRNIAGENIIVKQGKQGVDMTKIISFNSTATQLWNNFYDSDSDFTVEDAAAFLVEKYGIDNSLALTDAQNWVDKLYECGAIEG
ncbi:MAG: PqqD family protein [Bacteroidia bacterium]|nr:PqqD family protein [Bacteroidia bacterium]